MQIVHFTEEKLGSLDWELPELLARKLEGFSADRQKYLLKILEKSLRIHILDLQFAVLFSKNLDEQLELVYDTQLKLSERLKAL